MGKYLVSNQLFSTKDLFSMISGLKYLNVSDLDKICA
jgi:hypothetical protein